MILFIQLFAFHWDIKAKTYKILKALLIVLINQILLSWLLLTKSILNSDHFKYSNLSFSPFELVLKVVLRNTAISIQKKSKKKTKERERISNIFSHFLFPFFLVEFFLLISWFLGGLSLSKCSEGAAGR